MLSRKPAEWARAVSSGSPAQHVRPHTLQPQPIRLPASSAALACRCIFVSSKVAQHHAFVQRWRKVQHARQILGQMQASHALCDRSCCIKRTILSNS